MGDHSVFLRTERCTGCTACIKVCPADAVRVRNGKAKLLTDRCIDCGKCIQACRHKAARAVSDPLERMGDFRYTVALPEPALFGQFHHLDDPDILLGGLLGMGFDGVYEVAVAAEQISRLARQGKGADRPAPRINSACPAVLRLIRTRFPKLLPHVEPVILPMELAAILARREAVEKTGLKPEEIGVFAIVPCSAKVTVAHQPMTRETPVLDGAFAIRDIYLKLLAPMEQAAKMPPRLSRAGAAGLSWSCCGGESAARGENRYVAADGIENVIRVLEEIEDDRMPDAEFVELAACTQGCVGGCLNVENPYAAKMRLARMADRLPARGEGLPPVSDLSRLVESQLPLEAASAFLLDKDRGAAMEKLMKIEAILEQLPGLDCASCGAPGCQALAEDIVLGLASPEDCIFRLRARVRHLEDRTDPAMCQTVPSER